MTNHDDVVKDGENVAVFYSLAIEKAHFGRYKYIIFAVCGLAIASISAPGSSLAQKRNVIACNLVINYDHQMNINLYTFTALITGSLLIAIPSDLASRLKPLVTSLIFYGLATLSLGFCTEYYCLAFLSIFRAFWASALLTVTIVYVAEIQTPRCRGLGLCYLQISWLIGLVLMPVLSIPWRISQFIFGILALGTAILIACFFPESPRLLLSLGKKREAIESLGKIYKINSLDKRAEYPVKNLIDDSSPEAQNHIEFRTYIPKALRPSWYCLFIVLQIQFVFNLCFFTMSYWFQQIKARHFLIFSIKPSETQDCKLDEKYLPAKFKMEEKNASTAELKSICNSYDIETENYYKEVLILALVTLPILIWMILRLDDLGRSFFTTLSHMVGGLLSFFIHFLIGTRHDLLYTCLMESMWIISTTTSYCLVTEIFGTRIRVLGVGLANSSGYMGMAMGIYGLLLKEGAGCIFVISLTGILLTVAGFLTLSLPDVGGVYLK